MAERRTIGDILIDLGRITQDDVDRALQHQQRNGGFFGEALIALGIVAREELEWTLASQFDIPYVFPEADSVDLDAAALVTAEWALANLTVPIMKTADAMMVIVDSPIRSSSIDELEKLTGLRIELALASSGKIRELIRQVYARIGAHSDRLPDPIPGNLTDFVPFAFEQGAVRFGISIRGARATGWYETATSIHRTPLAPTWAEELDRLAAPPPTEQGDGDADPPRIATWSGEFQFAGSSVPVEASSLRSNTGREFLFTRAEYRATPRNEYAPPPAGILAEIGLLVRTGPVRFLLSTSPGIDPGKLLPQLPALLLDPMWRSVHLRQEIADSDSEVFLTILPEAAAARTQALREIRDFRFDVVTALLPGPLTDWVEDVADIGRVTFVPCTSPDDREAARRAGFGWELRVTTDDSGATGWSLAPLLTDLVTG